MHYSKQDAKAYARAHFRGVWAATATPFDAQLRLDEAGFKTNLKHWIETLRLGGLFVCGKQGEFFSMSVPERKRTFELAVEAAAAGKAAGKTAGKTAEASAGIVTSCSDTNLDVVLDLARHSQAIGADYIVVHSPLLHFGRDVDDTVYEYYRYLSERLDIGIALWNHPDSGYLMSPELCMRIAELPNIVAIKYSVPREMYARLSRMAGDQIIVSTASEEEWFDNIVELGWRLYLCSTPPFTMQTAADQRINDYTRLAFEGKVEQARTVRDSLAPVRAAFKASRPKGTPQAHTKYWMEQIAPDGAQVGGSVRRPLLNLTESEKAVIRDAVAQSGLRIR